MAQDSKLKLMIVDKMLEANKLRDLALREGVEAEEVAKRYINALSEINAYCEQRKRY